MKINMKTKNILAAALVGALALGATNLNQLHAEQSGSGHYMPGATATFIDASPGQPGWVVEKYIHELQRRHLWRIARTALRRQY